MNSPFTSFDSRSTQLDALEQEIQILQKKMAEENSATALHDLRLRIRFLSWKKELLAVAYGRK